KVLTGVIVFTAAAVLTPMGSSAAVPTTAQSYQQVVPLVFDWQASSPAARGQALERGIGPDNTVSGNCGTSSLYMSKGSSSGHVNFNLSADSSWWWGPILRADWNVHWHNSYTSGSGDEPGGEWWGGGNLWTYTERNVFTRPGYVSANMNYLRVETATGGVCYGADPGDGGLVG
ncbi:MAG: hypothetical protein ACRDFS_09925, partial [Chloroflexota bacterium]